MDLRTLAPTWRTGIGRRSPNEPQRVREWAHWNRPRTQRTPTSKSGNGANVPERTRRPPASPGMLLTHPNEPDVLQASLEWIEHTRTNPTTPREHGNGPNGPKRHRRPPGRTAMGRTHLIELDDNKSSRELTECNRTNPTTPRGTGMDVAHPTTPWTQGNGPKALERTTWRTGMDDPHCPREWTERTRTNPYIPRCRPVRSGAFGPFPRAQNVVGFVRVRSDAPCVSSCCVQFIPGDRRVRIPVRSSGRRIRIPIDPRSRRCRSGCSVNSLGGVRFVPVRLVHSGVHRGDHSGMFGPF